MFELEAIWNWSQARVIDANTQRDNDTVNTTPSRLVPNKKLYLKMCCCDCNLSAVKWSVNPRTYWYVMVWEGILCSVFFLKPIKHFHFRLDVYGLTPPPPPPTIYIYIYIIITVVSEYFNFSKTKKCNSTTVLLNIFRLVIDTWITLKCIKLIKSDKKRHVTHFIFHSSKSNLCITVSTSSTPVFNNDKK